jgi:hypothetical protein
MGYEQSIVFPMRIDYTPVFREVYKLVNYFRKQSDLITRATREANELRHAKPIQSPLLKPKHLGQHVDIIA